MPVARMLQVACRPEKAGKNLGCSTIAPIRSITWGSATGTSCPKTSMKPWSAVIRPSSIRIVVVLPEPLGPRKPWTPPSGTFRSRPSTARCGPRRVR